MYLAGKAVGLENILGLADNVKQGSMTVGQATARAVGAVATGSMRTVAGLSNPFARALVMAATNADPATGKQIVRDDEKGTTQGDAVMHGKILDTVFPPYQTYHQAQTRDDASPASPFLRYLRYGPADYSRAAGVKMADTDANDRFVKKSILKDSGSTGVDHNQMMGDFKDAYKKMAVTGDDTDYYKVIAQPKFQEYVPAAAQRELANAPWFLAEIARERAQRSTNANERQGYIDEAQRQDQAQLQKGEKGLNAAGRSRYWEGLQQRGMNP